MYGVLEGRSTGDSFKLDIGLFNRLNVSGRGLSLPEELAGQHCKLRVVANIIVSA